MDPTISDADPLTPSTPSARAAQPIEELLSSRPLGAGPTEPPAPLGRTLLAAALIVLVLFAAGIGAGVGIAFSRNHSSSSSSGQPPSQAGPGGSGSGGAKASSVAAQVSPAVVDVESSLGLQGIAAAGTGMVLTSSGEVLTNNHVVEGATSVTVRIAGRSRHYPAKVLGTDRADDVALLQIQGASGLRTVRLGDSSKVAVGEWVLAIGNASNLPGPPTVTQGNVTALDRSITAADEVNGPERLSGLIQIDAALRQGDSGGPLVNTAGEAIGMNTAASRGFRFSFGGSAGFAIPINQAASIARQIEAGSPGPDVQIGERGYLGVEIDDAASLAPGTSGAVVTGVVPGGPAQSAGLAGGDVIVSVDSRPVDSASTLTRLLNPHHPGDSVDVGWVDRAGRQRHALVHLGTGPAA